MDIKGTKPLDITISLNSRSALVYYEGQHYNLPLHSNSYEVTSSPLFQILIFGPIPAPRPPVDNIVCMDLKPPSKGWDVSWPTPSTHISKSRFPK